jgi:CRISPR/Cas system endoribonuclease Cas6 (RAMP superfamily)
MKKLLERLASITELNYTTKKIPGGTVSTAYPTFQEVQELMDAVYDGRWFQVEQPLANMKGRLLELYPKKKKIIDSIFNDIEIVSNLMSEMHEYTDEDPEWDDLQGEADGLAGKIDRNVKWLFKK